MRSLFGRIFLWFCATVFCAIMLGHIVGPYLDRPREFERFREEIRHVNTLAGTALVDIYERQGVEALKRQVERKDSLLRMYLYDAAGRTELTGRTPPESMREFVATGVRPRLPSGSPPLPLGARAEIIKLHSTAGTPYRMLLVPVFRPSKWRFFVDRLADGRLPLFLAAGVVFSFLLARSLTAPLRRLQATVKRLGRGDLTPRTGGGSRWDHREIRELGGDFDRMADRVQTIMDSHRRLLRDISHELRSPLTRINVALDLARRRCGDPAGSSLTSIATDAARMESLIDQMLTLSRLDGHEEQPADDLVNLGALTMQIIRDADIEAHGRRVDIMAREVAPVLVRGSEELLRRAVENVVRNALAHSPDGGNIVVGLELADEGHSATARLTVRDQGPGVPEDELESIFEAYYRSGAPTMGKGNMGLGLAITKRAVRLHRGSVSAANAEEGGLAVTIVLPALAGQDNDISA